MGMILSMSREVWAGGPPAGARYPDRDLAPVRDENFPQFRPLVELASNFLVAVGSLDQSARAGADPGTRSGHSPAYSLRRPQPRYRGRTGAAGYRMRGARGRIPGGKLS